MAGRTGPLANVTIIDCTMALAGPFGTALLADLGADVIKIEPPHGDGSRSVPPLPPDYANATADEPAGVDYGGYFASINRNKRSVVLDLKREADKEVLLQLCEQADALVENMRVGVMDKLGVGYDTVKQRNPKLVYAAIRGFGDPRTGESPYAEWPAYDIVAQSMSGHAHITGPEGNVGYPSGVSVGDIYPGTLMALGVVSAITHARSTGQGQFLDVGIRDVDQHCFACLDGHSVVGLIDQDAGDQFSVHSQKTLVESSAVGSLEVYDLCVNKVSGALGFNLFPGCVVDFGLFVPCESRC